MHKTFPPNADENQPPDPASDPYYLWNGLVPGVALPFSQVRDWFAFFVQNSIRPAWDIQTERKIDWYLTRDEGLRNWSHYEATLRLHAYYRPAYPEVVAALNEAAEKVRQHANRIGTLKTGAVCGLGSCVITDSTGLVAECRRYGRRPFPAFGDLPERKAHTIKGSNKRWPVGLGVDKRLIEGASMLAIVEGGPDYLAAWHFILRVNRTDILPVALLGRSIHGLLPEAVSFIVGKCVWFFPHVDGDHGGFEAMQLVGGQLAQAGCADITLFDFHGLRQRDGSTVKDLNNLVDLDLKQATEISDLFQ